MAVAAQIQGQALWKCKLPAHAKPHHSCASPRNNKTSGKLPALNSNRRSSHLALQMRAAQNASCLMFAHNFQPFTNPSKG